MCSVFILLGFLYVPSDSVTFDTYVKWLPRLSISQVIGKVTCVIQFAFTVTFGLDIIQLRLLRQFMIDTWSCAITSSNIPTVAIF